jgi:Uma2 family endonuclease
MVVLPELAFESTRTLNQSEFTGWLRKRSSWDCSRYELLNGRVVMTPPSGYPHGFIEGKIGGILEPFIRERQLGVYLGSSQGFELPSGDTVAPDHSFVSTDRWQAMPPPQEGEFLRVVPDLIVEILSPSTASHDRGEKRAIYERNGVREYWLVDSRARELVVFTLHAGRFDAGQVCAEGAVFRSEILTGLEVDIRSILPHPS